MPPHATADAAILARPFRSGAAAIGIHGPVPGDGSLYEAAVMLFASAGLTIPMKL